MAGDGTASRMTRRRSLLLFAAILSLSLTGMARNGVGALAPALPDKLTDTDFWSLVAELSEPDGEFRSDNLLSNEICLQYVIPELVRDSKPTASTSASVPSRTSPTSPRSSRRWCSLSTSAAATCSCT